MKYLFDIHKKIKVYIRNYNVELYKNHKLLCNRYTVIIDVMDMFGIQIRCNRILSHRETVKCFK